MCPRVADDSTLEDCQALARRPYLDVGVNDGLEVGEVLTIVSATRYIALRERVLGESTREAYSFRSDGGAPPSSPSVALASTAAAAITAATAEAVA